MSEANLIIYKTPDGQANIALYARDGNVWLTQAQMAELFATSKQNVSSHIINILEENELRENSVVKDFLTTAADRIVRSSKRKLRISCQEIHSTGQARGLRYDSCHRLPGAAKMAAIPAVSQASRLLFGKPPQMAHGLSSLKITELPKPEWNA